MKKFYLNYLIYQKEVQKKINLKVIELRRSHEEFVQELELYIPSFFYNKWRVEKFLKKHSLKTS